MTFKTSSKNPPPACRWKNLRCPDRRKSSFGLFRRISLNAILLVLCFSGTGWAKIQVIGIRHWVAPDRARLVLDLSSKAHFRHYKVNHKRSLVVEIPGGENKTNKSSLRIRNSPIKEIRFRRKKKDVLGVVVDMGMSLETNVFILKKYQNKPDRLVIDVFKKDSKKARQRKIIDIQKHKQAGKKIVVLDPGHGGEDPGAVGRIYQEKNIVLKIARKCMEILRKEKGIQPAMTRTGDYYISLGRRVQIAEAYGADLFVSIHTNASYKRKIKGSSIYFLSHKGASDKASRLLAQRENASDLLGGVQMGSNRTLNAILINMNQTTVINDSILMGNMLSDYFTRFIRNVKMVRKLKSAPFAVLKSPRVPSILFETAFISNSNEEKMLGRNSFQWELARTLTRSIIKYFGNPGKDLGPSIKAAALPKLAKKSGKAAIPRIYVVQKGDTVFRISKRYGVNMASFKKINNIGKSNRILVGQKLKIP